MFCNPPTEELEEFSQIRQLETQEQAQLDLFLQKEQQLRTPTPTQVGIYKSMKYNDTIFRSLEYSKNTKDCYVAAEFCDQHNNTKKYYGQVRFFFKFKINSEQFELAYCDWFKRKESSKGLIIVDTKKSYTSDCVVRLNQLANKIALIPRKVLSPEAGNSEFIVIDVCPHFVDEQ